jgi:hypothetical protein
MKGRFKRRRKRKFRPLRGMRGISLGPAIGIARKWGALRRSNYHFKHW